MGGILAKQLTSAGLKVVALERGPALKTAEYAQRDSIRYIARPDQLEGVRHEPRIFRTSAMQPGNLRYGTSPFNVLGGSMLLWTGQASRFMPGDFKVYSNEVASGLADRAEIDLSGYDVVDWPIGYDDLEPYYERFEWEFGVAGVAGMNPFAGPRQKAYPLPPLKMTARDLKPDADDDIGCQIHVLYGQSPLSDCLGEVCLEIFADAVEPSRDVGASDHKPSPERVVDGFLQEFREGEGHALDGIRHIEP